MIEVVRDHHLECPGGQTFTVPSAMRVAPGLLVYRLPERMLPHSPHRWRVGHEASGRSVVDAMNREDALAGATLLASMADWTQSAAALRITIKADLLYQRVSVVGMGCVQPASEPMPADVSRNGTYSDADIELYAAECRAEELDAFQITCAMSHTVPWMGLDTDDFNDAHGRIVVLAGAA